MTISRANVWNGSGWVDFHANAGFPPGKVNIEDAGGTFRDVVGQLNPTGETKFIHDGSAWQSLDAAGSSTGIFIRSVEYYQEFEEETFIPIPADAEDGDIILVIIGCQWDGVGGSSPTSWNSQLGWTNISQQTLAGSLAFSIVLKATYSSGLDACRTKMPNGPSSKGYTALAMAIAGGKTTQSLSADKIQENQDGIGVDPISWVPSDTRTYGAVAMYLNFWAHRSYPQQIPYTPFTPTGYELNGQLNPADDAWVGLGVATYQQPEFPWEGSPPGDWNILSTPLQCGYATYVIAFGKA